METLGQYVKREREQRHITQEEIAKITKYHISKIEALEEDKHQDLPASPYVKGMLRSIAKHLGLDVNDLLLRYNDFIGELEQQDTLEEDDAPPNVRIAKLPFYKKKKFILVSATTTFVVLIFVVAFLFKGSKKLEPIGAFVTPSKPTAEEAKDQASELAYRYKIMLQPAQDSWFKIQLDSQPPYPQNITAGESVELKARKALRFFVSEAEGLKIFYNDKVFLHEKVGAFTFSFPPKK